MLFVGLLFFGLFTNHFLTLPWNFIPYLIIAVWLIGGVILYIFTIKYNYYILHKKYFIVKKYNKELTYNFSEIIYIDEEQSEKSKTICFVTDKQHVRYLSFDKEGVLYQVMLAKCTNRMDKETFFEKHPNIKI